MTPERYHKLMKADERLTKEEFEAGWHFCYDWDGLLIGPEDPEYDVCTCRPNKQKKIVREKND